MGVWHLNHIKVINEVHVVWPRPFNCPYLRGVAARAGSGHLMFSMDWKPNRKGGVRPRPKQHHPVPQGPPFSIKCWLATGCLPEAHNQSQLKHAHSCQNTHKYFKAVLSHYPHKSSLHFLCGRGNITSLQPHPLQTIVSFRPAVQYSWSHQAYSASLTGMASPLTSCHAPTATWRDSKVTRHPEHAHPLPWPSPTPQCLSIGSWSPANQKQKNLHKRTCTHARTHTLHMLN